MNKNAIIGGLIFVISLLIIFVFIPQQISEGDGAAMGPRFFPKMVVWVLAALSALLFVQSVLARKNLPTNDRDDATERSHWFPLFLLVVFSFVYIVAMRFLGFMVPTIFFLSAVLALFGERRKLVLAGISVVGSLVIFVVFGNVLNLLMPSGLFTPWFEFLLY